MMDKQPATLDGEIRRAQLLRAQGDFNDAVHSLSQLMLVAPDDPRVVGEYGKVLAQQGRSADALAFLNRAIELQPDNWTFYSALGVTYDQLGERDKAEDAYKHALALKPDEPTVLNNYAMSQMMAGNLDRAEDLLHQAASPWRRLPQDRKQSADDCRSMRAKRAPPAGPRKRGQAGNGAASTRPNRPPAVQPVAQSHRPGRGPGALTHPASGIAQAKRPDAKPRPQSPRVVMQKVPYDPLAGKVYGHHTASVTHTAAKAQAKAPTQKMAEADTGDAQRPPPRPHQSASSEPTLRTATDLY